jgi:hypothetical protein
MFNENLHFFLFNLSYLLMDSPIFHLIQAIAVLIMGSQKTLPMALTVIGTLPTSVGA